MPEEPKNNGERQMPPVNHLGFIPLEDQVQSPIVKFWRVFGKIFDGPVTWFKVNVSDRFKGPSYPYYHRKFHPVPSINECYTDDLACIYEAQSAYLRLKRVDFEIIKIIKQRYHQCSFYERTVNEFHDLDKICLKEKEDLHKAEINLFIKYGEIGPYASVIDAFMKQKHRLIWERRQKEKEMNGEVLVTH